MAVLLGLGASASACSDNQPATKPSVERIGKPVAIGNSKAGRLEASSQRTDGRAVTVDEVELPGAGYVAIYADGGGAPGRMLGVSRLLDAGTAKNIRIALSEPLESSSTVHVMLHTEDNKNKTFDFPKHDQPITSDGRIVEAAVKITVS